MSTALLLRASRVRPLCHAEASLRAASPIPSRFRMAHTRVGTPAAEVGKEATASNASISSHLDVVEDAVEVINNTSAVTSGLMHSASNAFLELPHLLGGTSYAATIVLLTLFLRSSITLPMIIWQRRRIRRVQELVVPAAKEWMSSAKYALRAEFRKANKSYEQYVTTLNARAKKQFKLLAAKYKCRPLPTMLLPPLVHLPVFIGTTLTIRDACTRSSMSLQTFVQAVESNIKNPIDDSTSALALESLAWCPSLADVDPYSLLPVAVGVTALLNVEIQARIRQALAQLRENVLDSDEESPHKTQASDSGFNVLPSSGIQAPMTSKRVSRPAPSIPSVLQRKSLSTTSSLAQAGPASLSQVSPLDRQASSKDTSVASAARSRAITNVLRFGSILFIPIAAASPVAVNLYWLTSNIFSLTQNLVLGYRDRARTQQMK